MSLLFARYEEDENSAPASPAKATDIGDLERKGAEARAALLERAKGRPIDPEDTKGVWL